MLKRLAARVPGLGWAGGGGEDAGQQVWKLFLVQTQDAVLAVLQSRILRRKTSMVQSRPTAPLSLVRRAAGQGGRAGQQTDYTHTHAHTHLTAHVIWWIPSHASLAFAFSDIRWSRLWSDATVRYKARGSTTTADTAA